MERTRKISRQIGRRVSAAAERTGVEARNIFSRIIRQKEVNVFVGSVLIFLSLYVTFVSVLHRPLMEPLVHEDANSTFILYDDTDYRLNNTYQSDSSRYKASTMSIFLLWLASNIFASIFHGLRLPTLLGGLVTGIICKNVDFIDERLYIEDTWSQFFRKAALTVILIRAGIGLDPVALRKTKAAVFRLGIIATLIEASSITLIAHFAIKLSFSMSVLFGIILAATSPAVTIPTMLELTKKGYGASSEVPAALIASCAIDNMTCIIGFNIVVALIFAKVTIGYEFSLMFTTIILSGIAGVVGGRILWDFPYEGSKHVHSIRWILSLSICLALNFGTLALEIPSSGVIATVILNMVASIGWKKHYRGKSNSLRTNNRNFDIVVFLIFIKLFDYEPSLIMASVMPYKEAETFAHMWKFFAMQILFGLIGYEFDFKKIHSTMVLKAFLILSTGAVVRILAVYLLSYGSGLRISEQFLMSLAFFSKATLQAALSPQVVERSKYTNQDDEAHLLLSTCVIGIIIMAPIGQLILQILGPLILSSKGMQNIHRNTLSLANKVSDRTAEAPSIQTTFPSVSLQVP